MKPIGVGDLVMQIRTCCDDAPSAKDTGKIAVVGSVFKNRTECTYCKQVNTGLHASAKQSRGIGVSISWLIRIDPPAELDSTEREKELIA